MEKDFGHFVPNGYILTQHSICNKITCGISTTDKMSFSNIVYYVDFSLLACDNAYSCRWLPTFLQNICKHTLKIDAVCFPETLVTSCKTTQHHGPDDHDRYLHRRDALKSQKLQFPLSHFNNTENPWANNMRLHLANVPEQSCCQANCRWLDKGLVDNRESEELRPVWILIKT